MISYRITKFDPSKRNSEGHYLDPAEWTAISDIGKSTYRNVTYEEYQKVESSYVKAIRLILKEKKISSLEVNDLSLYNTKEDLEGFTKDGRLKNIVVDYEKEINTLKDSLKLSSLGISKYIRLILREILWMRLLHLKLEVKFGYDYYMYVTCEALEKKTIQAIEKIGLFVEPYTAQRVFTFIENKR